MHRPHRSVWRRTLAAVFAGYAIATGALLLASSSAYSQNKNGNGLAPIYRCPEPPVRYTDEISPVEAKRLNCRLIENIPPARTPDVGNLTPDQIKTCTGFSKIGFDMASRQARGWTKQEQISHYRKLFGDTNSMVMVNDILNLVYGTALKGSSPEEYQESLFGICKVKFEPVTPKR